MLWHVKALEKKKKKIHNKKRQKSEIRERGKH